MGGEKVPTGTRNLGETRKKNSWGGTWRKGGFVMARDKNLL